MLSFLCWSAVLAFFNRRWQGTGMTRSHKRTKRLCKNLAFFLMFSSNGWAVSSRQANIERWSKVIFYRSSFVTENLQENRRKEERKCHETPREQPKLWKSVIRTISFWEVMILIWMGIFRSFLRIPQPLLLGYLISSLMSTEPQQKIFLYGCALALGFSALMEKLSSQTLMYRCELLGITLSSALNGLVYKVDTFASVNYRGRDNSVEKPRSE